MSPVLWHLQSVRDQKSYTFTASHGVRHGANKLGYDIEFDVSIMTGYNACQYTRIKAHPCASSIYKNSYSDK